MLDLAMFKNKLFAAAAAAAFMNGFARFALMFLFVFYFQGPQGQSPIMAGLELAPLAVGMLVASPLAGIVADRHGSRGARRRRHARVGGRPRRHDDAAGAHALRLVRAVARARRHRLGHVQQPEHGRDDGRRPGASRGIAAGARVMLKNTGAVISIAFVMAIVTAAVPKAVLFKIFSGLASGLSAQAARSVHRQHAHGALGARRRVAARRRGLAPAPVARHA